VGENRSEILINTHWSEESGTKTPMYGRKGRKSITGAASPDEPGKKHSREKVYTDISETSGIISERGNNGKEDPDGMRWKERENPGRGSTIGTGQVQSSIRSMRDTESTIGYQKAGRKKTYAKCPLGWRERGRGFYGGIEKGEK